ncbi:MAG: hypothetical protein COW65_15555 [Cytophagales bacterium CG18_big_fil_WC_8_21_14_2_50_42_9]|nr:MAG: hypothetical protein COW65_15555 [Cytophagales bacterium CG18_big_fil_WC_8_21_14_2_50_42_9]
MAFSLSGVPLTLQNLKDILQKKSLLEIPADILSDLSTGKDSVNPDQAAIAQEYLAVHAVSFGPEITEEIIRLTFIIHLQNLVSQNTVEIQATTINRLLAFYNRDIFPLVQQQGSSAAQLAQLILPAVGVGKVKYQGYELNAADILDIFSWEPLNLTPAEVTALLQGETFSLAYSASNLLLAKFAIAWVTYLGTVFTQIASANPDEINLKAGQLQSTFEKAEQAFATSQPKASATESTAYLTNTLSELINRLQSCTDVLAQYTAETFENLISTSEPPATTSFAQALALIQILQLQTKQFKVPESNAGEATMPLQLLNKTLVSFIPVTEQIIALAFWSVSQVGKVFNLAAENITLAAYYHSELFVPKEMVTTQLDKTITFIKTHIPTNQA